MPGARHRLGAVGDVQLAIDTGRVGFDGARGHDELTGGLLVDTAQGHELKDFHLALVQWHGQVTGRGDFFSRGRARMRFGIELGEQTDSVVPQWTGTGMGQPLSEQHLHWLA